MLRKFHSRGVIDTAFTLPDDGSVTPAHRVRGVLYLTRKQPA